MKIRVVVASLLLAASFGARASAQAIPDTGITPEELAKFVTSQGEPAKVEANSAKGQIPNDSPSIVTSKVGDIEFDILLYDCKDGKCTSLQYEAGWNGCSVAAESINAWNAQRRWVKGVVLNNICYAGFDIIIAPGTSYAYLADTLAVWKGLMPYYLSYLSTGAMARLSPDAELNGRLASLEIGKTKYSDILNRFGRPASETHLAEGGRNVTYAAAQMTGSQSDTGAFASAGAVVTMTFDEHGRLAKLSPSPEGASGLSSGMEAPGRARNTLH
jgi:hypothetical protein